MAQGAGRKRLIAHRFLKENTEYRISNLGKDFNIQHSLFKIHHSQVKEQRAGHREL
jgi:hypothetical protein